MKQNLIRIVRTPEGNVEFDPIQRKRGRGTYLCRKPDCIAKAKDKNLIAVYLRKPVPADLYLELAGHLKRRKTPSVESLLGFAAKAGQCALGSTAVRQAIHKGKIRLLVVSEHAGESTRTKMEHLANRNRIPFVLYQGERPMEDVVGKSNCRAVGILDPRFAFKIEEAFKHPID